MAKAKAKKKRFTKRLYVEAEEAGDRKYGVIIGYGSPEQVAMSGKTVTVGVYELVGKKRVHAPIKIEDV